MSSFTPYEKLGKKQKREIDRQRRNTWPMSPITRKSENSKAYKRKKAQKLDPCDPASL